MAVSLNTNISAIVLGRIFERNQAELNQVDMRLATQNRVSRASDDPSGFAMMVQHRQRYTGLAITARNIQDGIAITQIAQDGLARVQEIFLEMQDLALAASGGAANSTGISPDLPTLDTEFQQLKAELIRIADTTMYRGQRLLDGSFLAGTISEIQIGVPIETPTTGITNPNRYSLNMATADVNSATLVPVSATTAALSNATTVAAALTSITTSITNMNKAASIMGAYERELGRLLQYNNDTADVYAAAEGRIRDADLFAETTRQAKLDVMQQAIVALTAQANSRVELILGLLK